MSRIDIRHIKSRSREQALAILRRILPGGYLIGDEYVVRNPKRADRQPGSFRINRTGPWADFAIDARGGDLISLIQYLYDCRRPVAAAALASMVGIGPVRQRGVAAQSIFAPLTDEERNATTSAGHRGEYQRRGDDQWEPLTEPPADAPEPDFFHVA